MAEPGVDREAISTSVKKDDNSRLVAELKGAFPSADLADIKKLTRDELIERVIICRLHLKQTSKVTSVLEGILSMSFAKADSKSEEVVVAPSLAPDLAAVMMAMNKMFLDQLAAQEKIRAQEKKEALEKESQAKKEALEKESQAKKEALEKEARDKAHELQLAEKAAAQRIAERDFLEAKKLEEATKLADKEAEIREAKRIEDERRHADLKAILENQRKESEKPEYQIHRGFDILRNSVGFLPMESFAIPEWFHNLHKAMELNRISDAAKLPILQQLLNPRARNLLSKLSDQDTSSFRSLQDALLREFQVNAVLLNQYFKNITKKSDESYVMLHSRLRIALVQYWRSREISVDTGNEMVLDLIISDKIKSMLPRYLENFVRGHEIKKWLRPEELCSLLDAYNVDFGESRFDSDKSSGDRLNRSREGYVNKFDKNVSKQNSSASNAVLYSRRSFRCTLCDKIGDHLRKDCPKASQPHYRDFGRGGAPKNRPGGFSSWLKKEGPNVRGNQMSEGTGRGFQPSRGGRPAANPDGAVCHTCGDRFHFQADCPRNKQWRNVQRVGMSVHNSTFTPPDAAKSDVAPVQQSFVNRVGVESLVPVDQERPNSVFGSSSNVREECFTAILSSPSLENFSTREEASSEVDHSVSFMVSPVKMTSDYSMTDTHLLIKCGSQLIDTLLDTGSEISVAHPHMLSEFLEEERNVNRGRVKLRGPFGDFHICETALIPVQLVADPKTGRYDDQSPIVYILCAITDKLADQRMLLSNEDFKLLQQAILEDPQCEMSIPSDHSKCQPTHESNNLISHNDDENDVRINNHSNNVECPVECGNFDDVYNLNDLYNPDYVNFSVPSNDTRNNVKVSVVTRASEPKRDDEEKDWLTKSFQVISGMEEKPCNFAKLQKEDISLEGTFKLAAQNQSGFFVEEKSGLLFKSKEIRGLTKNLLVLPESKRESVIALCHSQGHFGIKKCTSLITRNFTFPKLKQRVTSYISSCLSCAQRRKVTKFDRTPIKPYSRSMISWECVSLDILGPLSTTKGRNKYILGMVDLATGWVELYPLKSLESTEVLKSVLTWICMFGVPASLSMDNAINLNSSLCLEIYKFLHLEARNSTPYHSTGQAIIERAFLTVKHLLSSLTDDEYSKNWDLYLPYLMWCFRNIPNELSGFTAYELVYGHPGRSAGDILYDVWTNNDYVCPDLAKKDQNFFDAVKNKIEVAVQEATENRSKNVKAYIDRYNDSARVKKFVEGDSVLILMGDSSHKLKLKWRGPATITRVLSSNTYMVFNPQDNSVKHLHANKLRKFEPRCNLIGMIDAEDEIYGDIVEYPIHFTGNDHIKFEEGLSKIDVSHLSEVQAKKLKDLLRKHQKVFSQNPGCVNSDIASMKIEIKQDTVPRRQQAYRIPERLKPAVEAQISQLEKMGILQKSSSHFCHPVVLVNKPDGSLRICGNFKEINRHTIPDRYPMKRIDDMCHAIAGSNFITTLDAVKGYYQIAIEPESRRYTAIVTHCGIYEHTRVSFGLMNSAAVFQRCMDKILERDKQYAGAYIDDVCCHTNEGFDHHLSKLDNVLNSIGSAGMTLKLDKCQFVKSQINFLGFTIGKGIIQPNPDKLKVISELVEPTSKKEVRSFLAMCRFYMRHLPHFSDMAVPLTDLTKNSVRGTFIFNDLQRNSFMQLKQHILNAQRLYVPNYDKEFYLVCDASDVALAGSLNQRGDDGIMYPIEFCSKKFTKSQLAWPICQKECYSILYSLQKFDAIIVSAKVIIVSDHHPLSFMTNSMPQSPRLIRWMLAMNRWRSEIVFQPGVDNPIDYVSRHVTRVLLCLL